MKIGFDIDEVLCDLTGELLKDLSEEHEVDHTIEVFSEYNFANNSYTGDIDLDTTISKSFIRKVNTESYLVKAQPNPDASGTLDTISSMGHEIHLISARSKDHVMSTIGWLNRNRLTFDSIHNVGHVDGHTDDKGCIGKMLSLDAYIDDYAPHIDCMYEALNSSCQLFLLDKPWNRDYINSYVTRVYCLKDMLYHLRED